MSINPRSLRRLGASVLPILALAACSEGPAEPGDPVSPPGEHPPLLIEKAPDGSGDLQSGLRGTDLPLPLRALVTQGGVPVSGVRVTWQVFLGPGGDLESQSELTDADGTTSARFRLGTAGRSTVLARLEDGRSATFYPTALPATVQILSGNDQVGEVGTPLPDLIHVRVTYLGKPIAGEQVRWTGSGSGESAGPTDANGETTARLILGTVAGYQAFAPAAGSDPFHPSASVRVDARNGPGVSLQALGGWGGIVGAAADGSRGSIGWLVHDQFNNPVPGGAVQWRVVSGQATLAESSSLTGPEGYVQARFTASNSTDEIVIGGTLPDGAEVRSVPVRAWDIRLTCPWGCYLEPATITRPAGSTIRFSGGEECQFAQQVPGHQGYLGAEFVLTEPGTYSYECPSAWYEPSGSITIVP